MRRGQFFVLPFLGKPATQRRYLGWSFPSGPYTSRQLNLWGGETQARSPAWLGTRIHLEVNNCPLHGRPRGQTRHIARRSALDEFLPGVSTACRRDYPFDNPWYVALATYSRASSPPDALVLGLNQGSHLCTGTQRLRCRS